MPAGRRKYEKTTATNSSHWMANGDCITCGQKITNSPKNCSSKDHIDYYRKRQDAVNRRRRLRTGNY